MITNRETRPDSKMNISASFVKNTFKVEITPPANIFSVNFLKKRILELENSPALNNGGFSNIIERTIELNKELLEKAIKNQ